MPDEIWVYVELQVEQIPPAAREALAEGHRLAVKRGARLGALLTCAIDAGQVQALSQCGVQTVYVLEHPLLSEYQPETYLSAILQAIQTYRPVLLLASSCPDTLELFPALAARLSAPILTDCTQIDDADGRLEFTRPAYGGMAAAVFTCTVLPPFLATLHPGAAGMPVPLPTGHVDVTRFTPNLDNVQVRLRCTVRTPGDPTRIDLTEAEVIVAGGKGASESQDWALLARLAISLGAALGGSRPALDAGHIRRARMIGQTGKNIRGRLYLAAGISGSTYHLRGVNAEHLLAINCDPDAPIFKTSQCGVCGDLRLVIPELLKQIE